MRHITQACVDLIEHFEGFSSTAYVFHAGYPTIGYGHVIPADERFDEPMTEETASDLLGADVNVAETAVLRFIDL